MMVTYGVKGKIPRAAKALAEPSEFSSLLQHRHPHSSASTERQRAYWRTARDLPGEKHRAGLKTAQR